VRQLLGETQVGGLVPGRGTGAILGPVEVCTDLGRLGEELQRLGIGTLAPLDPSEIDGWPANLEGGWHQIGTTRMHEDPRRGVVDPEGRLHGMTNLFVAGSSVFPTAGAAPPTLTVVAMALRLADRLRRRRFFHIDAHCPTTPTTLAKRSNLTQRTPTRS